MLLGAALIAASVGCASPPSATDWAAVREVTPEFLAKTGGMDATIATGPRGRVALTFVTLDSTGKNLWLSISRDSGLTFAPPVRVNLREGAVDSYPESRPAAAFGPGDELAITWSERRADTSGAIDLVVRASADAGATLGMPSVVNDDRLAAAEPVARRRGAAKRRRLNPRAFHGFPALTYLPDGSLFTAWIDGREDRSGESEPPYATLYAATSPDGGRRWNANVRLADSVCSCCRPTAASDAAGRVAVGYRRAERDLRDPGLLVSYDRGATFPLDVVVSPDHWLLDGCPAQGPGVGWTEVTGGQYVWFTGADPPGVYTMSWDAERGPAGLRHAILDSLDRGRSPRVATAGRTAFFAVEGRPRGDSSRTVLAVRAHDADGSLTPWSFLGASVRGGWIAALDARNVLACWTERDGERRRVRIAKLTRRASPS